MREFFEKMLSSEGKVSSKRFITFIAFGLIAIGFLVDLFTEMSVSEHIYSGVEYIVIAGLGFTASERFVNWKKASKGQNDDLLQG
jgi:hypothetical protein